ncbi:MAG: ATP-binding protein [Desulfobulbaceae bacterium]|nr:ATP-binding protein [Desulfobulbaceae bacterium]
MGKTAGRLALRLQGKQERETGSTEKCKIHPDEELRLQYGSGTEKYCAVCWEEEQKEMYRKLKRAEAHCALNLSSRLRPYTFDNYKPTSPEAEKALSRCRQFAQGELSGLIMLGSVGTGKTHMAVAICKAVCDTGTSAMLVTVNEIIREIKDTWKNSENEQDVIDKYSRVNLLVIDEIGSQYGSDTEKIFVSEIINNRYNNMLRTAIIGNITLSEAQAYLGIRVIDRLRHNGDVVVFDWESYRK